MNRKIIIFSALILMVVSCSKGKETKPIIQNIKELVFASGNLEWENNYNLVAQTDGILSDVNFEVGNKVTQGTVLAKIDNATNQVNVQTAKEQLAISSENLTSNSPALLQLQQNITFAEAKYNQDKTQAERYKRLYETQSVAKSEFENYQLTAENSLSSLNALKKQYNLLQQQAKQNYITTKGQLKNSEITENYNQLVVPQNGTVIEKLKDNGDYVRKGDVIAKIGDASEVEAVLNVDESSIAKIKIGQTVYIKLNTEESITHNAKIVEILAAFDEKTQSFICKAKFDEHIEKGFYGTQLEANIYIQEKKNALLIPRSLMDYGNKVNVKGKDEPVVIEPGIISSEYVEVLKGISKDAILLPITHK